MKRDVLALEEMKPRELSFELSLENHAWGACFKP
jgi:hypothetical protein